MKTLIGTCLAGLLFAGGAFAQQPSPDMAPRSGLPPRPGPIGDEQPRPPGPAKSARFRLQVGRIALGLTCPDDEPLKACSDFAMQLLDKAEAMRKAEQYQ